ncbi:MAG: Eco57I restriction-modification methylase domain-containing protein, partial [Christensenellaceae bacterium]
MNREQLQDIFRQPYNAKMWQELLINLFGASEIRQTPSTLTSDSNEKVEGFELGRLYTGDRYEIGLFAFEIKQGHNVQLNRVGLRSLVRSYTRYNVDAALVVYYDATHWRLSFICDIKEQKTAPKRYTYVFGNPNESYRTASAMLAKLADGKSLFENIKAAFSVEALSKDFFKGYKEQYGKFCKYIGGEQKWQRDYVKKMMGRLVFLQFLQKKGWMGCGAAQADWTDGDLQYTQNLIKRYEGNEKLLSDILESLFFDTLNTKREGDIVDPKLGDNIKIPYLNGGLFDQDKLDEKQIDFPYSYFAELMDFFSQYNFTIDENDPYDAEVGIDPEMLGHIFENLLEDNKDKGAFYTPKEIVQYMCRQSLIEYLQSKLGKHTEIENFINNHDTGNTLDSKNYVATNAKAIEELLDSVKVCDPAIGSGAFPMGILNEIFHAKMALNMTLNRAEVKKNIIQNSIYGVDIEQGAVDIARLRFWLALVVDDNEPQPLPNLDYKIMCGNSLLSRYALDMPFEDVFKEYNKGKSESERMSLAKYKQLVADYTNTSDHTQKAGFRKTIENIKSVFRTELSRDEKEKFAKLKVQIIDLEAPMLFGERTKKEQEDLRKLKIKFAKQEQEQADIVNNKLYEDAFEWRFEFPQLLDDDGKFVGFDIVIGNPPYVNIANIKPDSYRNILKAKFKSAKNKADLYAFFIERGFEIMNNKGTMAYIIPHTWKATDSFQNLREIIFKNHKLTHIVNLEMGVFGAIVKPLIAIFNN